MAQLTQPTEDTIVTEAHKLFGVKNPDSTQLTRAKSNGLAFTRDKIMDFGREWAFLRTTSFINLEKGTSKVQAPSNYSKFLSASVLQGTRKGTAQAGASTTITLAASDTFGEESTKGKLLVITSGTGSGQGLQIKSYDNGTKIATMAESWTTTPDNTSVYFIVDRQDELTERDITDYEHQTQPHVSDRPGFIFHGGDNDQGEFFFDKVASELFVIRLRYYQDLRLIDLASDRYNTILYIMQRIFTQGVFVWLLQDDARVTLETQRYETMLGRKASELLYPNQTAQQSQLAGDIY